jgi:hypothetical protein
VEEDGGPGPVEGQLGSVEDERDLGISGEASSVTVNLGPAL